MTEEYTIREHREESAELTEIAVNIATLTDIITDYNMAAERILHLKTLACPGLSPQEQALMTKTLKALIFGLRETGALILRGREAYYAEQGIRLDDSEKTFGEV